MEGYATITTLDRENGPAGSLQGKASTLAGRKLCYIGASEQGQYSRLNMARMIAATGSLFFSYEVVVEFDIQLKAQLWKNLLWAVGHEYAEQTTSATVETSGESGDINQNTLSLLVQYDNGTKWRVKGAALVAMEVTIQPRRLASIRVAFGALQVEQYSGSVAQPDNTPLRPVSHLDATIGLTTAATWPGDPLNAALSPCMGATFRFERDFAPARFGEDGYPTRWAVGHGWRGVGSFTTRLTDMGLWHQAMQVGIQGKLGAFFRPSDQSGSIDFFCDQARIVVPEQNVIDRNRIDQKYEWTSYQTSTAAPMKIAAVF